MLRAITDLGDSALLLPASAALCAYLWMGGLRRAALAFAGSLCLCIGLTLIVKIGFHACGHEVPGLGISSPSGHTAFSTTVYGCGALLLGETRERWQRTLILLGAALLVLAIAESRILLHAHSGPEVAVGLAIGILCVALFRARTIALPEMGLRVRLLLAAFAMLAVLTHGQHLNAEEVIAHIAKHLRSATDICEAGPDLP